MSAETAVVLSFSVAFAGLATYGFKMMDSEQELIGFLGTFFVSLALGLLQVIVWVGLEIADTAGYADIVSGATAPVLWIVMLSVFIFWLSLLLKTLYHFSVWLIDYFGTKFGKGGYDG